MPLHLILRLHRLAHEFVSTPSSYVYFLQPSHALVTLTLSLFFFRFLELCPLLLLSSEGADRIERSKVIGGRSFQLWGEGLLVQLKLRL